LQEYLLPLTPAVAFAAGFTAVLTAPFGAHFFVLHFFTAGAAFATVFFRAAAWAGFAGAAAFFVAMLPPLQVVYTVQNGKPEMQKDREDRFCTLLCHSHLFRKLYISQNSDERENKRAKVTF
jgi:hypothetical protein